MYFLNLNVFCDYLVEKIADNNANCYEKICNDSVDNKNSTMQYQSKNNAILPFELLFKKEEESIQKYVKRLFTLLYDNNYLDDKTLIMLQDKIYCRLAFGIDYPLLITDAREIKDKKGHNRYWTKFKLNDTYYVCSEWWKDKFHIYEQLLHDWINMKFGG